jgi:multimeric flavodoxin WrbA
MSHSPKITAIYGSPRRKGNTALLLREAVRGASESGAQVTEFVLRDLKMSPCLEIYHCKETGRCAIKDDFNHVADVMKSGDGLMVASPIFFYAVSAHTKILMDRCQSMWVKKYWLDKPDSVLRAVSRKAVFISVGATKGKRLFDGALLSMKYFFDVLDMTLWRSLLYRGLDFEGDVLQHPGYLQEAYRTGKELAETLKA